MTPEQLQAAKEACEQVPKGPWWVDLFRDKANERNTLLIKHRTNDVPTWLAEISDHRQGQQIADFIALARTALPAALAEIERLRSFDGCDGCSTGDCPHMNVNDCVKAQGQTIAEQAAEIERLRAEIERLREAVKKCMVSGVIGARRFCSAECLGKCKQCVSLAELEAALAASERKET